MGGLRVVAGVLVVVDVGVERHVVGLEAPDGVLSGGGVLDVVGLVDVGSVPEKGCW